MRGGSFFSEALILPETQLDAPRPFPGSQVPQVAFEAFQSIQPHAEILQSRIALFGSIAACHQVTSATAFEAGDVTCEARIPERRSTCCRLGEKYARWLMEHHGSWLAISIGSLSHLFLKEPFVQSSSSYVPNTAAFKELPATSCSYCEKPSHEYKGSKMNRSLFGNNFQWFREIFLVALS